MISRVKELLARPRRAAGSLDENIAAPLAPAKAWATPVVEPSSIGVREPAAGARKAEEYFDRLDAAFASFSTGSLPEPATALAAATTVPDELDWFGAELSAPAAPPADLPLSYGSPQVALERIAAPPPPIRIETSQKVAAPAPLAAMPLPRVATPAVVAPFPPLADAFAAMLAAEQNGPGAASVPVWRPAPAPSDDDVIERVTRRVLEQLSEQMVRETVAEMVSGVAERLVREEIGRIKAAIK